MAASPGDHPAAYLKLAADLRSAIEAQKFSDGRQLPTEAELMTEHRLSRQTVRRAYLELVSEGLVHRIPGRGTFVSESKSRYLRHFGSVEDLLGLAIDTVVEVVETLHRHADIEAAGRLGLETDLVYSLTYVRAHLGTPFGITTVYLPPAVAARVSDRPELTTVGASGSLTVIGLIEGSLGERTAAAEQTITAVGASSGDAAALGCRVQSPLLRIDRLFLDADGVPIELSVGHYLPEQYTYRVTLSRARR